MKYPGNSTVTFTPEQPPPPGAPYTGDTNSDGSIIIVDGVPFVWIPEHNWYAWQEPGPPPGDWRWIVPMPFDLYILGEADASFMVFRSVEAGHTS